MAEINHIPQFLLDQLAGDLFEEAEKTPLLAHLDECETCAADLKSLREARQAFLSVNPPDARAKQFLDASPPRLARWVAPMLGAAAAILFIAFLPSLFEPDPREAILFKGGPAISFMVKRPDETLVRLGIDGERLPPGTAIQLRMNPAGSKQLAVYGMAVDGAIEPIASLTATAAVDLPSSLILDEGRMPERILVVFSDGPVGETEVQTGAKRALEDAEGALGLVKDFRLPDRPTTHIRSILIRKTLQDL